MTTPKRRLRLCLKDLYQQDVVEMIERETRAFELWEITHPDDPDYPKAYKILWDAFGPAGEMEREDAIRHFLTEDVYEPLPGGSFIRYFLIVARDKTGKILGVRDGSVMINPDYAPDICVVYLSHLFMLPEARGTVLSYELRIAPIEVAIEYMKELHRRGKIKLPDPDHPGKHFGMRIDMVAEMEYYSPEDPVSWKRILFYGRGGFDAVNPRHFPYLQPDFRDPETIRKTGNQPHPFMILVRRIGRERQATMPLEEASAIMRLLYDDFMCHCTPDFLENSLQLVLDRLTERSKRKPFVELLPLPTGAKDLGRIKKLFRYHVYQRHYKNSSPAVPIYLNGPMKEQMLANPRLLEDALVELKKQLEERPRYVYASRDREPTWEDTPETASDDDPPHDQQRMPPEFG